MLAQDRHEGRNTTGRQTSKRQARQPTKFMFIDSSNGGVNAKPDRVVRSFVMKSARNKKPWSTRPKSPKEEDDTEKSSTATSVEKNHLHRVHNLAIETWDPLDAYRKDSLWDCQSLVSPASSRSGSFSSAYSNGRTCDSPCSCYTHPFSEHKSAFNFPVQQVTVSTYRDGFDIRFAKSLDCLPVHLDVHTQRLLHQFVEGSAPRLIPVDVHRSSSFAATDWIANCIQSPNGAPYIYAALTASARAVGLNSEAYKWRAISEVNKLLSNPNTSTNDTTLATVLVLLALEESDLADPRRQGSDRDWSLSVNDAHLNGLRTMVWQRGGLAALNGNHCLQVFILMHSIAQCITAFKRPYALLVNAVGQTENYASSGRHASLLIPLPAAIQSLNLDPALLDIVRGVQLFSSDLAKWYNNGHADHQLGPYELQKHACLLTYRLFEWYQLGEESELAGQPGSDPIDQSICLAYLIYLVVATEPYAQTFGSRLSKTVAKLRKALQSTSILHWGSAPDLFLWTLTMGAIGAKGLPQSQQSHTSDFAFFAQYSQLSFASSGHDGLTTADQLLWKIQHCPWIPSVFDARARRLWAQMGLCGAELSSLYDSSSEEEELSVGEEYAVGQSTTARFFPALKSASKKSSPR